VRAPPVSGFHEFVHELLEGLGPLRIRRMFGVAGVYAGEVMFAVIDDDVLYLKTDGALAAELDAEGSSRWVYREGGRPTSYWRLPESALDDPEAAVAWACKALALARAGAVKKRPRRSAPGHDS